jgi:hypothetical protein
LPTTAEHHKSLHREFPNMAIYSVAGEESNGLAGRTGRCIGFRVGCNARLRAHHR